MKDANRRERELMVESQIRSRGVNDPGVLEAMCNVPREQFVINSQRHYAFSDGPLPIGNGQTISQPYIVAYMTELLEMKGTETVLELGTGSGYQTAVLAEVAEHVYTVEVIEELSGIAKEKLLDMNYKNISFRVGNGKEGWKEHAPFDRIMLTAAPAHFPQELFAQLKENGIIVAPVGSFFQRMMLYRKIDGKIEEKGLIAVSFVPFV